MAHFDGGSMNERHYPEEWGPSNDRRLTCSCGNPDPSHMDKANAAPVAWRTFDGEGGYEYRSYEGNETYRADYIARNGEKYAGWVQPLYLEDA
jgi:hypothetical protein